MATCIYCGAQANSNEDWLPRGFGAFKNMTLLKDRLCVDCNNALGREVDEDLLRTGFTAVLRSLLKIEGRHGPPPNPFGYRVMGPVSPTSLTRPSPDGKYQILGDPYLDKDGIGHTAWLRQMVFRVDGTMVPVPFLQTYTADMLKRLLVERGVLGHPLVEIYLDPDEDVKTFDKAILIEALGAVDGSVMVHYGRGESILSTVGFTVGVKTPYLRAVAKVAFHYYLWGSTTHTGAEAAFEPIRNFIRHGIGDWRKFVCPVGPQLIKALAEGQIPSHPSHFVSVRKDGNGLFASVQFFAGAELPFPPFLIRLGFPQEDVATRVHQAAYYGEKIDNYDGEIKTMPL